MSLVFDTLKLSKTLGRAFTPEQAEVLTEALTINVSEALATKADLAVTKADLKAEIADVKAELKAEIADVKAEIAALETKVMVRIAAVETMIANVRADLIRWFVSTLAANILAMTAVSITVAKLVAHR